MTSEKLLLISNNDLDLQFQTGNEVTAFFTKSCVPFVLRNFAQYYTGYFSIRLQMKEIYMSTDYDSLMKIIKGRRSIRRFKSDAIPKEKIKMLIEAARWAPSAGNSQPWEFLIITDKAIINNLKTVMTGVMGSMKEGPLLILICTNKKRKTTWTGYDIGCALQNILLSAHSMNLGACAIGGFDELFISQLLDLREDLEPCVFITVGYPEKEVPVVPRRETDELIVKEV
jgi:nitroreductase